MTSFENLIANHFYINLDKRNDRMISCEEELNKLGLVRPNRFAAIEHKMGIIGCGMSHLKCIQMAKEENLPYVTIFEDDIVIPKPNQVKNIVNRILESKVEWDIILLSGNNFKPNKEEHEDYSIVQRCYTTTAYIIKKDFYDIYIENLKEGLLLLMNTKSRDYSLDAYWIKLQIKYRFLLINPLSIYQKPDYSDIENKEVDYHHIMLNNDK